MRRLEALETALTMLQRPQLTRLALRSSLPRGVTFLLEIAAGDAQALSEAQVLTRRPGEALQKAAGFFIEQVLLSRQGDSYRILGASPDAPLAELRRHMALIMKWLHPDLVSNGASGRHFDRTVYANRVTQAWETVKTAERRVAYDAHLAADRTKLAKMRRGRKREDAARERYLRPRPRGELPDAQLALYRLEGPGFLSRFMLFLRGGRR
jgi:hypothetical protein